MVPALRDTAMAVEAQNLASPFSSTFLKEKTYVKASTALG
jgi:hypothetical protein